MNGSYTNVLDSMVGDVNGDKIGDFVYLIGTRQQDTMFVQNITLLIQDQTTGTAVSIPLNEDAGYQPTLFLGDFTGNGINDILISIATGGSGGTYYYYIYTYILNQVQLIFDSEQYNKQYRYEVIYQNDYKVLVISNWNQMRYLIDLSLRDPAYLDEIYDENGTLRGPIEGWVDPISGLYPIDYNLDKTLELLAYQKISGKYHADSLGYIQNTLKWGEDQFGLERQYLSIYGYEYIDSLRL